MEVPDKLTVLAVGIGCLGVLFMLSQMSVGTLVLALFCLVVFLVRRNSRFRKLAKKLPGPPTLPLVGNLHQMGQTTAELYSQIMLFSSVHGPAIGIWMGPQFFVGLSGPEDVEILLSSNKHITKSMVPYWFLQPWLGTGLLTSTGEKWHHRRKMLTPAFHFKILEQFVHVFNKNEDLLIEKLAQQAKVHGGEAFDIYDFVTLCTLDIICESSMGVAVNAQNDRESTYVKALRSQCDLVMGRAFRPWLYPDWLFDFSSFGKERQRSLKILHDTTYSIINKRRKENEQNKTSFSSPDENDIGQKKKRAFLDLLLEQPGLTDEDIREEVDTFLFEGHDTTTSAISFALLQLSTHENIQEKIYEEVIRYLPEPNTPLTLQDLQEMKYLEQVIKEALRLYPSVPAFGRELKEDLQISTGNYVLPAGSIVVLFLNRLHRNPKYFPNPEEFDPERFSPENVVGRHPYVYVPFSAGPRNCIGQKFAMLEMKSMIAKIVRNFRLLPSGEDKTSVLEVYVILKSMHGIKVKLVPRE